MSKTDARNYPFTGGTIRVLIALLPGVASATVGLLLTATTGWPAVGVPAGDDPFGDLTVALAGAECARGNYSWSLGDPPCNDLTAIYNYPPIWAVVLGALGIGTQHAEPVAVLLILAFAVALALLTCMALNIIHVSRVIVLALVGISPPVLLGYQRGNIDLLVFLILVLAATAFVSHRPFLAGAAAGLATALKLFPVGASLMFIRNRKLDVKAFIAMAIVSLLGLIWIGHDLVLISGRTPLLDGASFGASQLPLLVMNRLFSADGRVLTLALGLAVFGLGLIVLTLMSQRIKWFSGWTSSVCDSLTRDRIAGSLFALGGGVFLVSYLAGPSFDYRLIFLIPAISGLLRLDLSASRAMVLTIVVVMFLSYSTFIGSAEYFGDLILLVLAPYMALIMWRITMSSSSKSFH